jgi:hypothetical protein
VKLIDNWRKSHKMLSVQLAAIGAAVSAFALAFPDVLMHAWTFVPTELKEVLPERWRPVIGIVMFVGAILARIIAQPKLNCDTPSTNPQPEQKPE